MTTATLPAAGAAPSSVRIRVCEWVIGVNGALAVALLIAPRLVRAPLDAAFFGQPLPPGFAAEPARSAADIYAVIASGITLGWMVALFGLVRVGVARGDRTAWAWALGAVVAWFVADSAASVAVGYAVNVPLNVAFAAPFVAALVWARPAA